MEQFTEAQKKDLKILIRFVGIYCEKHHAGAEPWPLPADLDGIVTRRISLCPECRALLEYSLTKRRKCPLDPKPSCKKCHIHCYTPQYRARIREVMAFSGRHSVMRGRLDLLWHYLF